MKLRFFSALMICPVITVASAGAAGTQAFPNRPVRIVTTDAGGGTDFVARIIAPRLAGALGQQVIVENRGGSVIIPAGVVSQASPDGHSLLFFANPLWLLPFLQDHVPYDPVKTFAPIVLTHRSPNILVVNPASPAKSVQELISLAKAKPGSMNYASGGLGSSNHLAAELFNAMAGVKIERVLYKGAGPAITALLSGEVQLMFATAGSVTPHMKSGRLRALAVTSAEPSALAPGLPTVAAAGLRGYESVAFYGIFAPAATPAAVIKRLNEELARVLTSSEVKERLLTSGVEVVGGAPAVLAQAVKADMATTGKLIKDVGIHVD